MPEHRNWAAIIAEALCQIGSECIRAPAQLTICQGFAVANMCSCFRGHCAPAIDSFDQIHSETLINKRLRSEIATAIHQDQRYDDGEIIENQQYAMLRRMFLEPADKCNRYWRSAIIFSGVRQPARSNSAGGNWMQNHFSLRRIY